ncbi:hexapeptide transferase [Flavobacteriaceae bacterium Ap0902]|nr:hexapeptide transferase [Flavobacteriaceae bacterium Ap0902]
MLVIGAKGLAIELLDILLRQDKLDDLAFYDDINPHKDNLLYGQFPVLKNHDEAQKYFTEKTKDFILGVGFPEVRHKLYHQFKELGGNPINIISDDCIIGHFNCILEDGVTISYQANVSNNVLVKKGTFINSKAIIGHDSVIGEFCEICPSVNIAGHVEIGDFTFIGTGVIIYPNVKIGKNVSITAGSIVRKNIPDNAIVHGVDGKIIKLKKNID